MSSASATTLPSRDTARAMSEENVEVSRRLNPGPVDLVAVFADPEGLTATRRLFEPLVEPDFELVAAPNAMPMGESPNKGKEEGAGWRVRGVDGFIAAFRDWLEGWESWVVTPTEFLEADEERVVVLLRIQARSKTHQVEVPVDGGNLLTIRNGRLARLELFLDRAEALAAAGLSE